MKLKQFAVIMNANSPAHRSCSVSETDLDVLAQFYISETLESFELLQFSHYFGSLKNKPKESPAIFQKDDPIAALII